MYIVFLKFSVNKEKAAEFMAAHNDWLKSGFDNDIFILAGSLQANQGGAIIAGNIEKTVLEETIATDPFVLEKIVTAEILEFSASKANEKMQFLLAN